MTVQAKRRRRERTIPVDAILMSAGWTPSVHLFSQSRGKVAFDDETKRFLPGTYAQDCVSVGACNGTDRPAATIAEALAPARRRRRTPAASGKGTKLDVDDAGELGRRHGRRRRPAPAPDTTVKAFVDFQNDVTAKDIRLAVREGMRSIEHVKRFTTNGMATDQGKTSNMHGLAIAAETLGKAIPEVGLTTFRAPYTPVTFGAHRQPCRAALFDPTRKTPIHDWEEDQGAVFEDVGIWKRAWYFPKRRRGHASGGRPRMPYGARRAPACSTPRRSARSRSSGPTRPNS